MKKKLTNLNEMAYKKVYSLRFIPKQKGTNLLIEMLQNMPVLCLHMHSGIGYATTSLSLLLALISGSP